jgi:Lrp/AsnC family leucine-responsive transcriptional regulator
MINDIDIKIMNIIRNNAKISNADLARKMGMAPSAVLERVRKLESNGYITGYETRLDYKKFGLKLTAFIELLTSESIGATEIGYKLAALPFIQEIYSVSGDYCYLIKVKVADSDALAALLAEMGKIKGIKSSKTTLVLKAVKESSSIELKDF